MQVRNDSDTSLLNTILHQSYSWPQEAYIATKFVDHESTYTFSLVRLQKFQRPQQRGKDTSAINIAHQKAVRISHLCHSHIRNVVLFQIDLRGRSSTFKDNHVILRCQDLEALADRR